MGKPFYLDIERQLNRESNNKKVDLSFFKTREILLFYTATGTPTAWKPTRTEWILSRSILAFYSYMAYLISMTRCKIWKFVVISVQEKENQGEKADSR